MLSMLMMLHARCFYPFQFLHKRVLKYLDFHAECAVGASFSTLNALRFQVEEQKRMDLQKAARASQESDRLLRDSLQVWVLLRRFVN